MLFWNANWWAYVLICTNACINSETHMSNRTQALTQRTHTAAHSAEEMINDMNYTAWMKKGTEQNHTEQQSKQIDTNNNNNHHHNKIPTIHICIERLNNLPKMPYLVDMVYWELSNAKQRETTIEINNKRREEKRIEMEWNGMVRNVCVCAWMYGKQKLTCCVGTRNWNGRNKNCLEVYS